MNLKRLAVVAMTVSLAVAGGTFAGVAGAASGVTFTITVSSKSWASVQHLLSYGSEAQAVYASPADFIYSFVCEDGGSWSAPIPKKIHQGANGVQLRVRLSAAQVTKADKALRKESCGSEFGIHTVEQDYKFTSRASQVAEVIQTVKAAEVPATTTTTTPPESPAQYEAACPSPTYGALSSPNAQQGMCVTYQAQIFQYDSNTGTTTMLVDVSNDGYGDWSDLVQLILPQSVVAQNFIENDVIQFWGPTTTPDTYTTENNGTNTIPAVDVKYATLITAASS
jgi:hypothetical protein